MAKAHFLSPKCFQTLCSQDLRGIELFGQEAAEHVKAVGTFEPGAYQVTSIGIGEDVGFAEGILQELQIFLRLLVIEHLILFQVLYHFAIRATLVQHESSVALDACYEFASLAQLLPVYLLC